MEYDMRYFFYLLERGTSEQLLKFAILAFLSSQCLQLSSQVVT